MFNGEKLKIEWADENLSKTSLCALRLRMWKAREAGYKTCELVFSNVEPELFDGILDALERGSVLLEVKREITELKKVIEKAKGDN